MADLNSTDRNSGQGERCSQPVTIKMVWSTEHDSMLCREILAEQPFRFKTGTRERGQCWGKVANNLNNIAHLRFKVDQRAVRDRYTKLEKQFKWKMEEVKRTNGALPTMTNIDQAMQSIVKMNEDAQLQMSRGIEVQWKNVEIGKETAEIVRKRSMERMAQNDERENEERMTKRYRMDTERDTSDSLAYEKDIDIQKEEIELRKRELQMKEEQMKWEVELKMREHEFKETEQAAKENKDKKILELIQNQQHHQQKQQEQIQGMIVELQKQNKTVLNLLNLLIGDKY